MTSSDYISLAATIFSLFALGISCFELLENRPKLRVSGDPAFVGNGPFEKVFMVSVTNFGRQPTTITGVTFAPKRSAKLGPRSGLLFLQPIWEISTRLPHVLDVGRTATVAFKLDATVNHAGEEFLLRDLILANTFLVAIGSAWHGKSQYGKVRPGKLASWSE